MLMPPLICAGVLGMAKVPTHVRCPGYIFSRAKCKALELLLSLLLLPLCCGVAACGAAKCGAWRPACWDLSPFTWPPDS